MKAAALEYRSLGYSVIPCLAGSKKPAIEWKEYQSRLATEDEISQWWTQWPDANVALVCGEISGISVIDVDGQAGLDSARDLPKALPTTRVVRTPKGHHLYYLYTPSLKTGVAFLPGIDVRSGEVGQQNAGYVIAPPSIVDGKAYEVFRDNPIVEIGEAANHIYRQRNGHSPGQPSWVSDALANGAVEGERNDLATRLAGYFHSLEMPTDIIIQVLTPFALKCTPPLDIRELEVLVNSVGKYPLSPTDVISDVNARGGEGSLGDKGRGYTGDKGRGYTGDKGRGYTGVGMGGERVYVAKDENLVTNVTPNVTGFVTGRDTIGVGSENVTDSVTDSVTTFSGLVTEWVRATSGWWATDELDKDLGITKLADKTNRRKVMSRLHEHGIIEQHKSQNKLWRYIDVRANKMSLQVERPGPLNIQWPMGIENYVHLYPGNMVVVAGAPNSGKTALLLNLVWMNMDRFPTYYFCSEMGEEELVDRLAAFGHDMETWNFEPYERASDFADVIRPDCLNIIDFMELTDNIYNVNSYLTAISRKIGKGVAVIALQKKVGASLGRGQEFGLEKPRLYLSMDSGKITITKGKSWAKKEVNPNNLRRTFKILDGCDFVASSEWNWPKEKPEWQ